MDDKWYYVEAGERCGPVELSFLSDLISKGSLGNDDYVWKKGFENWIKVKDTQELNQVDEVVESVKESGLPGVIQDVELNLNKLANNENSIFIKIGADRGGQTVEYGPYSLDVIKKLFTQKRVNGKTFLFIRGMKDWAMLGEFVDYTEIFEDAPPPIKDEDRRLSKRKPFIARMYVESDQKVYVGVCRDISIGGMQVLLDRIPSDIGANISINVHPENTEHHFVAGGEIVRILEGGQGFSFRFINLNEDAKDAIHKYVENE